MTIAQLLRQLGSEGLFAPQQEDLIADLLTRPSDRHDQHMPWYLRGFIGFGAWIAAILLIAFISSSWLFAGEWVLIVAGVLSCIAALVLNRIAPRNLFLGQLALALCLAGQAQFVYGIYLASDSATLMWSVLALLEIALLLVYRDVVLRFLATIGCVVALTGLIAQWESNAGFHLLVIASACLCIVIWYREATWVAAKRSELVAPVGYALPIALFGLLNLPFLDFHLTSNPWISTIGLLIILEVQVWDVLRRQGMRGFELWACVLFVGVALLALPAWYTPGILAALCILLLAIQRGNTLLMSMAVAFLALFVAEFYYYLDLTLLVKSLTLLGAGGVLLALRGALLGMLGRQEVRP